MIKVAKNRVIWTDIIKLDNDRTLISPIEFFLGRWPTIRHSYYTSYDGSIFLSSNTYTHLSRMFLKSMEQICWLCHWWVELQEWYVFHGAVLENKREICLLFQARFWPIAQANGIQRPTVLGVLVRTQETWQEVIEGQQYNLNSSKKKHQNFITSITHATSQSMCTSGFSNRRFKGDRSGNSNMWCI